MIRAVYLHRRLKTHHQTTAARLLSSVQEAPPPLRLGRRRQPHGPQHTSSQLKKDKSSTSAYFLLP
ncbi:hypothetical protein DOTSEDRAFT_44623 [Dothistroma septosporum NZE10]|nr:hypothetical protein DOTSEDRAFT_44623 [Dothistroma septosporum NZE10]